MSLIFGFRNIKKIKHCLLLISFSQTYWRQMTCLKNYFFSSQYRMLENYGIRIFYKDSVFWNFHLFFIIKNSLNLTLMTNLSCVSSFLTHRFRSRQRDQEKGHSRRYLMTGRSHTRNANVLMLYLSI